MDARSMDPCEVCARIDRAALVRHSLTAYAGLVNARAAAVAGRWLDVARSLSTSPTSPTSVLRRVAVAASLVGGGAIDAAAAVLADVSGVTLGEWEREESEALAMESAPAVEVLPAWMERTHGGEPDDRAALVTAACAELAASLGLRCIRACILGCEVVTWADIAHDAAAVPVGRDMLRVPVLADASRAMAHENVDAAAKALAGLTDHRVSARDWYAQQRRAVVTG